MSNKEKDYTKALNSLISAIDNVYLNKKKLLIRSFISGIAYGLGITVGLFIVLFILALILQFLVNIPIFHIFAPIANNVKQSLGNSKIK